MDSQLAQNWIALLAAAAALLMQTAALGWWLSRQLSRHDIALATAIAGERDARSRAIAAHARVVASDIEHAKAEARMAREHVSEVRIEFTKAFREYPTKDELRQMLSDRIDPINAGLERLLAHADPVHPDVRRRRKSQ
jgi:hypothetical protein